MDLRLNARRRSINISVYVVFDLEAGRFKFLGENLLGALQSKKSFPPLTPSPSVVQIHSFVTSKQFKWET